MSNLRKKLSALVVTAVFATMQVSAVTTGDIGLGSNSGGAVIDSHTGGLTGIDGIGTNKVDLNFNASTIVDWSKLNVDKGETLNFNAQTGVNNLTILNRVQDNMSNIYGSINSNAGISKLILSNPNGVFFDGATFTTAADTNVTITTQDMTGATLNNLNDAKYTQLYDANNKLISVQVLNGSDFSVGGDFVIMAPSVTASKSTIAADTLKLVTANGQDYLQLGAVSPVNNTGVTFMQAMNVNGDVVITNDVGAMAIYDGGKIDGNLTTTTAGNTFLNCLTQTKGQTVIPTTTDKLIVNGDVKVTSSGAQAFARNVDIKGDLDMSNSGGFVDIGNINIGGNAKLTTTGIETKNGKYRHFVHVIGDTNVGGDMQVEASQNIHIGGYDYDANKLADGNLNVKGDLTAHSTDGHITTTIDTTANKISYTSDKLNVLMSDDATLNAKEYQLKSNGYIGGIKDYTMDDDTVITKDVQVKYLMENYIYVPDTMASANVGSGVTLGSTTYANIAGGKVTKLETPSKAYISSNGDMQLTGANAKEINLNAPGHRIDIIGQDSVVADNINVGPQTDTLKVEFPSRKFTLNYTNIRDGVVTTVNPNEEITYELTNGENGYNTRAVRPANTTYLIGPDKPYTPPNNPNPPTDENVKVIQNVPDQVASNPVNTPVAFAADLDDDEIDTGVRKNVDGSVTVVRAFPMMD